LKLIFIYNANSGKLNGLFDLGHKIINPDSYKCSLCKITHGKFSEKEVWKNFRETSSFDLVFLHKDEFEKQYIERFSYPVILRSKNGLKILLSNEEINKISESEKLINLIEQKVNQYLIN
jgi:hypothetical protein